MEMTQIFKDAMIVGCLFKEKYSRDYRVCEWNASEECALFAERIIELSDDRVERVEMVFNRYADAIIDDINIIETPIKCQMWNDICKGFLAGEIIGLPTVSNLKKVEEADELWADVKYGYYQEVLEEVK